MDSTLARLHRWYTSRCDGDWEHGSGISIATLDNPGWIIKINLAGTNLENRVFLIQAEGLETRADGLSHPVANEWHRISVKDRTFEAAGDPSKLDYMLVTFLDWAESE
jgi:hypothetical protein